MNEDESTVLRDRLIGAAAVCLLVFLLSLFIPEPAPDQAGPGEVVIDLNARNDAPASRVVTDPPASSRTPPVAYAGAGEAARPPSAEKATQKGGERPTERAPEATAPPAQQARTVAPPPAPPPATPQPPEQHKPAAAENGGAAGDWWIQAASYSDRETALRGKARAVELGHGAQLREVRVDGRQWWRLQIGPFSSEASARSKITSVEAAGFRGARALERQ